MFKRKMKAKDDVRVGMDHVNVSMRHNFEFSLRIKIEIRKEVR